MKFNYLSLTPFIAICVSSCDQMSKDLTTSKAQKAMEQVARSRGAISVIRIATAPINGQTKADISFTNFRFDNEGSTFTGTGEAYFSGYTDGKWKFEYISFQPQDHIGPKIMRFADEIIAE